MTSRSMKRSIVTSIVCFAYFGIAAYALRYVAERTGVSIGWNETTGDGILAYYAAIALSIGGSLILVASLYFLDRNSTSPIPESLFAALAVLMPIGLYYLSPSIPVPG